MIREVKIEVKYYFSILLLSRYTYHVSKPIAGREDKKVEKYNNLSDNYHFVPMGVECLWSSRHYASQADQRKNSGSYL